MKAIILAAGKWTRLQPLTLEIPKAMVEVFWKPLLEYNMQQLLNYVDEFIIIVKYKADIIKEYFWWNYKWIPITYHIQWEKNGTAGALQGIKVAWECFVLASDTIYTQSDIDTIATYKGYAALSQKVNNPEKYGIFETDINNSIKKVIEKPTEYIGNIASLFYFKVHAEIISYAENVDISERWEYELTDALNNFIKNNDVTALQIQDDFIDITSMKDLKAANTLTKPNLWKTRYLENIWNYELHLGIPQTGIQEIVNYSTDETDIALREWTSDWKKRFISIENLSSWYDDIDRYPFTLLSSDGKVAGLWWWRPAKCPNITEVIHEHLNKTLSENLDNTHTWAIRIYPFARWDRLASPFMKACSRYYSSLFPDAYMCVDIDEQNVPSQKAFERLWYEKVWYGKNVNNSPDSGKKRFVYLTKY